MSTKKCISHHLLGGSDLRHHRLVVFFGLLYIYPAVMWLILRLCSLPNDPDASDELGITSARKLTADRVMIVAQPMHNRLDFVPCQRGELELVGMCVVAEASLFASQ
jgi:hypothetical protein